MVEIRDAVPEHADSNAAAGETAEVPPGFDYVDDDLHVLVTDEIKAQAYKMFKAARENPRSGAGDMVRILLLNAVANMHADRYHDARFVLSEERRRGEESQRKGEMAQHQAEQLKLRAQKFRSDLEIAGLKVRKLQVEVSEHERRLQQVRESAEAAKNALENGQPLDAMAVYNKIAEIVGLRAPTAEQAVASGA
jgi:hypothetical protein